MRDILRRISARRVLGVVRHPLLTKAGQKLVWRYPALEESTRFIHYYASTRLAAVSGSSPFKIARRSAGGRQLLVDVGNIVAKDRVTGIERVVQRVSEELLQLDSDKFTVRTVAARNGELRVVTKRNGRWEFGDQVAVAKGDVWYTAGIDGLLPPGLLIGMRARGVVITFTVHDLIPLRHPQFYTYAQRLWFRDWLRLALGHADNIICVSDSVRADLSAWLREVGDSNNVTLFTVKNGADLLRESKGPTVPLVATHSALLCEPTFLMVGTIEPRKGHLAVLDAMKVLWRSGFRAQLVVVGRQGWRSHDIVRAIKRNPALNDQLVWLEHASDELLARLYREAAALVAASYSEGFGLPLVEAAQTGLPVIARDIAVFREVADPTLTRFFSNDEELADTLIRTIEAPPITNGGRRPRHVRRWRDTATELHSLFESLPYSPDDADWELQ